MTAIEELLEATLSRAASEVGAHAGLAEGAVASAGRMQRRRRAAGAGGVALVAVAAVAIAAVTGSSGERRATPVNSPTPVVSVATTNLPSVSPTPGPSESTSAAKPAAAAEALAQLHVLFAAGVTIHDGTKTIHLHPSAPDGTRIQALARLGDGYVVAFEGYQDETLAKVDGDGQLHLLDSYTGQGAGGARGFAVSSDGKSIAYAGWKTTQNGTASTIRIIDTYGHLLHSVRTKGIYAATALFPGQVWLTSRSDDASQPPAVWDVAHGTVKDVSVGPQTTIQAVDLAHDRVVLSSGNCGITVVYTDTSHTVLSRRCGVMATTLSPDGFFLLATRIHANTRDLYVLDSHSLGTFWSQARLPWFPVSSWTPDGRLVGVDGSSLVIIAPLSKSFTVERVADELDGLTMAANSGS